MNPLITNYIKDLEQEWQRKVTTDVRQAIHEADPEIEENIKWGAPAFGHNGQVAWLFCATNWVHLSFPQGVLLDSTHGLWDEAEDTTSKAKRTIKIRQAQLVPTKVITQLVKQAVANNIAGKKFDFNIPKPGEREFDLPPKYESILKENNQLGDYLNRPYYQQKGWIGWIEEAVRADTKEKRLKRMLQELQDGTYMPSQTKNIF